MRNLGDGVMAVHAVRIPVWPTRDGIAASDDPADGFYDGLVQLDADPSLEHRLLRERPASAVSFAVDWLIAYGRWSTAGKPAILPEARYAVWYQGEEVPCWSDRLKAGEGQPMEAGQPVTYQAGLDYATAGVDGADGVSFWIAHEYGTARDHRLVVGKVTP